MALQSSGAISLDDMHVELGESSGTTVSINDSDVRGLIDKADGASMSFNEWYGASNIGYVAASGGTETTSGNYKFHTFNTSGTLTFNSAAFNGPSNVVDYLVVAGGGSGGTSSVEATVASSNSAGGGGGGYLSGTFNASAGAKTVTVGAGGAGYNSYTGAGTTSSGGNSSLSGVATATGGGGGAYTHRASGHQYNTKGQDGGSGGGCSKTNQYFVNGVGQVSPSYGNGISGQGHRGSTVISNSNHSYFNSFNTGGGGGGAGEVGPDSSYYAGLYDYYNGQSLQFSVINAGAEGSTAGNASGGVKRAGGGGGGSRTSSSSSYHGNYKPYGGCGRYGTANDSGAGQGSIRYTDNTSGLTRSSGEANKGGGGGGTNNSSGHVGGGSGGSGVVIVRYQYQG